jgi:hypothetical protein
MRFGRDKEAKMKNIKGLSRRKFLGTAGTIITLPLLESLMSRQALAEEMASAKRLLIYYTSCGMIMDKWTPAAFGSNYELMPILAPLANLKKDFTILSNVGNYAAQGIAAVHSAGTTAFATGVTPQLGPMGAISADQLAANKFGGTTPYRSLQLSQRLKNVAKEVPPFDNATFCDAISWADAKTPLIPQDNPQSIFDNFFASANSKESEKEKQARIASGKSVLDSALAQLTSLRTRLGQDDLHKIDQYTTGLRAIEKEITSTSTSSGPTFDRPTKSDSEMTKPEYYALMHKMMILAFQSDLTRHISFMFAPGRSERAFDFAPVNVNNDMHSLSHDSSAESIAKQVIIQTYEMSMYASLLQGLKDIPDIGGASLLDNTISVFGNELSSGASHSLWPLPVLVAGGGGAIKLGQHIKAEDKTDLGAVWLTVLNAMGMNLPSFGTYGKKAITGLI